MPGAVTGELRAPAPQPGRSLQRVSSRTGGGYHTTRFAPRHSCGGVVLTTEVAKEKLSKQTNQPPNPTKPKPKPHHQADASNPARHSTLSGYRALLASLTTYLPALCCPSEFKRAAPNSSHTFTAPPAPFKSVATARASKKPIP